MAKSNLNFDNIMKVMVVRVTYTGATAVSLEIDFDIPRGYIVKIHDVSLEVINLGEDFQDLAADTYVRYLMALIKDPDDTVTLNAPSNTVDHDTLLTHQVEAFVYSAAGPVAEAIIVTDIRKEKNYSSEGLDVFTARNMRLNIDAQGSEAASGTEAVAECFIEYTLERITSELIIQLLDIL